MRKAGKEERAMAMARGAWLAVGKVVELRSSDRGFEGAWFKVRILELCLGMPKATVEYCHHHQDTEGKAPVWEKALWEDLRPLPPQPEQKRVSWEVRDAVESWWEGAWWQGYIKAFNAKTNTYRVYYGKDVPDLDIPGRKIRARQDWVPSLSDRSKSGWFPVRQMQDPAVWDRMVKVPVKKTTAVKKRQVAQIKPRVSVPARHVGDESEAEAESDGDSWEELEDRRRKKKPRASNKSKSAPTKKLKFVYGPKPKITRALPAIKPPPKASEQTIVCITPGSSPPLAESPFQDSEISPGSDSQAQKPLATPEASLPTKSSSISASSRGSGSSNSASSGEDDDDCGQSEDDDPSTGEGKAISPPLNPFANLESNATIRQCMPVYRQLLECFRDDNKGCLDKNRERILKYIKEEFGLPTNLCNAAHCAVFGLPPAFLSR